MLIDKAKEILACFYSDKYEFKCAIAQKYTDEELLKAVSEMAQALIAVDDVKPHREMDILNAPEDEAHFYMGFNAALEKIRKAMESTNTKGVIR